jgi:hypothetical protein
MCNSYELRPASETAKNCKKDKKTILFFPSSFFVGSRIEKNPDPG